MAFVWLEEIIKDFCLLWIEIQLESVFRKVRTFQHGASLQEEAMQIEERNKLVFRLQDLSSIVPSWHLHSLSNHGEE